MTQYARCPVCTGTYALTRAGKLIGHVPGTVPGGSKRGQSNCPGGTGNPIPGTRFNRPTLGDLAEARRLSATLALEAERSK